MKTSEYKNSIQKQLTKEIFLIVFSVFIVGYSVFIAWYLDDQKKDNIELAKSVTNVISQDMAKLVLLNDVSVGADITSKLQTFKQIENVILFDANKKPIYQYSKNKSVKIDKFINNGYKLEDNLLKVFTTVKYQKVKVGYIEFNMKIETLKEVIKDDFLVLIGLFIFMMLFSYFLASFYSKRFSKPILDLVKFLETIEFDDISTLKQRVKIIYDNEFGKLYEEINILLDKILDFINEQKIALVIFETKSGIVITDENMNILKVNKAYEQITGYSQKVVIGKPPPLFKNKSLFNEIKESLQKYNYWNGEIVYKNKKNQTLILYLSIQPVLNENKITNFVFSFIDITKQKEAEKKLAYLKEYDSLTGFMKKEAFLKYISPLIKDRIYQALFYIKIINLKTINNIYGYEYGDLILKEISDRLRNEFDVIAKIEANEFVIYDRLFLDKNKSILKVKNIIENIESIFIEPFDKNDKSINVDIQIGVTIFNKKENSLEVLKEANFALQTAKEQNKKVAFFDKHIEIKTKEHFFIYEDLLKAIKNDEFELYYQLQFFNDEVYGAESLIRWNHPEKGLVFPMQFIPIAEKSDLIVDIGDWVLNAACKQLSIWKNNEKTKNWILAVNVSAKQFKKDDFLNKVFDNIKKYNINPFNLKLELLESIFVDDVDEVAHKMTELKALGVQLSLDDFGTGFSSLQYLKNFPLDQIKIDQSFVRHMFENDKDEKIIKSIIYLGEVLDMNVLAEGVETKQHYEVLKKLGCHYFQGYYFEKPQPIEYINQKYLGIIN